MRTVEELPTLCPKCGFFANWTGPRYRHIDVSDQGTPARDEWLEWACGKCGYSVNTVTKDHTE